MPQHHLTTVSIKKTVQTLLGSAALALVLTLVGQSLSFYGVVDVSVARVFMLCAWLVAVAGVFVSYRARLGRRIAFCLILALVLGAFFFAGDSYLVGKRKELDAASHQNPPSLITVASPPRVPIEKTPRLASPKSSIIQHGGKNVAVNGNITAAPCSSVQVGNNNQATVNCPPPPKPLVPCDSNTASIAICNSNGTKVHDNKVFGGPPTGVFINGSDEAKVENNEMHQLPGRLGEVYNTGMSLSDDCHRRNSGAPTSDEDLKQAILRWKNSILPALEEADAAAWVASFGKGDDQSTRSLDSYCTDVDYYGQRMEVLRQIRARR